MNEYILLRGSGPDILIKDGIICRKGYNLQVGQNFSIIDTSGCLVSYGFADIHVHFREPGFSYKETIKTGSQAAAAGGYTTVCAMPNLDPVPDSLEHLAEQQAIIDRDAVVQVLPYASITLGRKGGQLTDFAALKDHVVAFSDDGSGVQSGEMMRKAMLAAAGENVILAAHCEDNSLLRGGYIHDGEYCKSHGHKGICSESEWGQIARDLKLCEETGCRYHVCHISTAESVALIRDAKRRGVRVTCETAPHYLCLCEDDIQECGGFKMNPPIRSRADREALIEGLKDGTIDAIATDHAPHSAEEKSKGLKDSAMGIVGLETAFPVLYTSLVLTGKVSLDCIVNALCASPRRIFKLGGSLEVGQKADICVIDLQKEYTIDSSRFYSKGHCTPFDGWKVRGKVRCTIKDGKIVYQD
jgi:dihydroorotase